jgi:cation:H+ antiporter
MATDFVIQMLIFAVSIFVLVKGSDFFIVSAEKIGLSLGVSPFIIGVTLVAFGTSMPELATSVFAVYTGDSAIVSGNVIGSNITNILLVLGIIALVRKSVDIGYNIMDIDMPMLMMSAVLLWIMLRDGDYSLFDGILCFVGLCIFLLNTILNRQDTGEERPRLNWKVIALFLLGGGMVYFGARFTIDSLGDIADMMGVGSDLIALSLVALGTSLPEVVVSITAAKRGSMGIAVGNILGSNIFNTYAVMSIASFFGELVIPQNIIDFALPFMLGVTFVFGMICISRRVSRWEGSMLILMYIFYIGYLFQ